MDFKNTLFFILFVSLFILYFQFTEGIFGFFSFFLFHLDRSLIASVFASGFRIFPRIRGGLRKFIAHRGSLLVILFLLC